MLIASCSRKTSSRVCLDEGEDFTQGSGEGVKASRPGTLFPVEGSSDSESQTQMEVLLTAQSWQSPVN